MSKKKLRIDKLNERKKLSKENVKINSESIVDKIINSDEYINANSVMAYMSFGNEVDTSRLVEKILLDEKTLVLSYTDTVDFNLIPKKVSDLKNLVRSNYGILEPINEEICPIEEIDLILIPGLVFDKKGNRIGFGKGYYDKFLEKTKRKIPTIAMAYDFQVVDSIPFEEHDIAIDRVFTELGIY